MTSQATLDDIQKMIQRREFESAELACARVLKNSKTPLDTQKNTLHLLGTTYYLQGQIGKSVECFNKILKIDPKHTDAAISLSIIYNDIGKYDEAKQIYNVANQSLHLKKPGTDRLLDRKFALKHIEIGDMYFKFHRYDDALEDYSRAARLDPQQLDTRIKLAKVYAKKGFTSRAIQELQQLCHEHPAYVGGRVQLGLMYFSMGNIIDAQVEWERALDIDPANPEIQTYLSMAKQATETNA